MHQDRSAAPPGRGGAARPRRADAPARPPQARAARAAAQGRERTPVRERLPAGDGPPPGEQRSRRESPPRPVDRRPGRGGGEPPSRPPTFLASWVNRFQRAWDRPLTAYYVVLGTSLLIILLGLVMVFSSSQIQALRNSLPATYFFQKQLVAAVIGGVLMVLAARMPVKLLRALTYPFLAVSIVLLIAVQIPGIGVEINGNTNWISVGGPFMLQPGEFAKLALLLWGADLIARKGERGTLDQWRHLLVPLIPGALLVCGLIMIGGDMGTVMILVAIVFGLLWLAGAPTRLFVGVLGVTVAIGAVFMATAAHRMERLSCVMASDPGPGDECWQAAHGIYALASGGWFGSGLGASVEKWGELPEPHTDFIFAITGEELGLAGTLSVLGLFAALGYAGIRVAGRTEDPFVRYAAGGITTWLMAQVVINIGAVLGLLPIAGVPLPLFSYGGSALLPTMFAVGLLIAFARSDRAARAALATRRRPDGRRPAGLGWTSKRRREVNASSGER